MIVERNQRRAKMSSTMTRHHKMLYIFIYLIVKARKSVGGKEEININFLAVV